MGACAVGVDTGDIGGSSSGSSSGSGHDAAAADTGPGVDAAPPAEGGGGPDDAAPSGEASAPADAGKKADGGAPADSGKPGDAGASDGGTLPEAGPNDSGATCAEHGFSGALVTFDLSAQPGSEASAPASTKATGVTASALSRASALTAVSGSGSINSSGWPSAATADPTKYYTFTVTPPSGCTMALSSLAVSTQASSTGPTGGDVATSVDGFAAHAGGVPGTGSKTVTLSASGAGTIEVRIYGFGATGTGGTYRVEGTLMLSGSLN